MKIQYWGTAAAEAFPALFCTCEACRRALALGGKNIRTRASALIDDEVMIDFSPDTNWNRLRYGYDMSRLRALCITHPHIDHLAAAELQLHAPDPYCRNTSSVLPVYCGADAVEKLKQTRTYDGTDPALTFTVWQPYHTEQVTERVRITPLPAVHDRAHACYIFLIESGETRFLYGNDTAFPKDEVFDFLRGKTLDGISLDCTFGAGPSGDTHMGMEDDARVAARLEAQGSLKPDAVRLVNHFSHGCGLTHEELEARAAEYGFGVTWDGLTIEI